MSENAPSREPAPKERVPRSAAPYYRVEESANQPDCQCDNCVMWTVVFDDGEAIEIGMSWRGAEGKDAAQDVCDLMNMAFDTGFDLSYDDPHESPREIISESNDD